MLGFKLNVNTPTNKTDRTVGSLYHFLSIVKINIRHILEKINAYQWLQTNNTKTVEKQRIYLLHQHNKILVSILLMTFPYKGKGF